MYTKLLEPYKMYLMETKNHLSAIRLIFIFWAKSQQKHIIYKKLFCKNTNTWNQKNAF